jgi:hypothetical protein
VRCALALVCISPCLALLAAAPVSAAAQARRPHKQGSPSIAGTLEDGQMLSATSGSWKGTTPLSFSYQWEECTRRRCVAILGATESSYRLTTAQIGRRMSVLVTAHNSAGKATAKAKPTGAVGAGPPLNTDLPTVSGTPLPGQTLSASTGSWVGTPTLEYSYQWRACNGFGVCADIPEAIGSTYVVEPQQVAESLEVTVTATNSVGSSSATSESTGLVGALLPSDETLPSISGALTEGGLLSALTGSWSGTAPISYAYVWELCNATGAACREISGALEPTLSVLSGDIGSTLRVVVTATNAAGSTSATSSATSIVKALLPSNETLPSITGTLAEGGLLSVATGTWSGTAPISYAYQWELCNAAGEACKEIPGALESTLSLVTGDIGSTVRVIVTATNTAGSTSVASPATSVVKAVLPSNVTLPTISGLLQVGKLLTAAPGSWSGTAPITYSYQWQTCNLSGEACKNIAEATKDVLTLALGDLGLKLRVVVTAVNAAGSASATSAATGLIEGLL